MLMIPMMASAQDFDFASAMTKFWNDMALTSFFVGEGWKNAVMICIACFLLWLAIRKQYEPLLLLPIAFGMLLSNIPSAGLFHTSLWNDEFLNPASTYYLCLLCVSIASQNLAISLLASSSSLQIGRPEMFPLVITSVSGISIPSS